MRPALRSVFLFFLIALFTQACDCKSGDGPGDGDGGRDGGNGDGGDGGGNGDGGDGGTLVDAEMPDVPVIPRPDVHVIITADNAYGFGYGSESALTNYFMGIEDNGDDIFECSQECGESLPACAVGECDAFGTCNEDRRGPETYVVPGDDVGQDGYLYVIAWSDESTTQGLIGQFRASDGSSPTVYTGSDKWEVCATGVDIDLPDPDPTTAMINAQIANCNLGAAGPTFSDGWIGNELGNNPNADDRGLVVLYDTMDEPSQFAGLCRAVSPNFPDTGDMLDSAARWMWFDDKTMMSPSAFENTSDDPRGDFLIFRLPISAVIIIE